MTLHHRKTILYFALSLALVAVAVFWVGAGIRSADAESVINWI